jgi:hypothetical protein
VVEKEECGGLKRIRDQGYGGRAGVSDAESLKEKVDSRLIEIGLIAADFSKNLCGIVE